MDNSTHGEQWPDGGGYMLTVAPAVGEMVKVEPSSFYLDHVVCLGGWGGCCALSHATYTLTFDLCPPII